MLARYGWDRPDVRCSPTPQLGFSGARLWRVETPQAALCLRRWSAEHPRAERLAWIHRVLEVVGRHGQPPIPVPLKSLAKTTFVRAADRLWQLEPWLPGRADYALAPSHTRFRAAVEALAQFHVAAATLGRAPGRSPGLEQRLLSARRLERQVERYGWAIDQWPDHPVAPAARDLLRLAAPWQPFLVRRLEWASHQIVPLQPCIRDVWHDHVLFEGDRVSGLVDFGGVARETVAADIARLVASLAGGNEEGWQRGVAAYRQQAPLSGLDEALVGVFDQANSVLGGLLWVEWLFLQRRRFPDLDRVAQRLDNFRRRLATWSLPTKGG